MVINGTAIIYFYGDVRGLRLEQRCFTVRFRLFVVLSFLFINDIVWVLDALNEESARISSRRAIKTVLKNLLTKLVFTFYR